MGQQSKYIRYSLPRSLVCKRHFLVNGPEWVALIVMYNLVNPALKYLFLNVLLAARATAFLVVVPIPDISRPISTLPIPWGRFAQGDYLVERTDVTSRLFPQL